MMILTGPFGTVLHTGDFRFSGSKMINDIGNIHSVDYLYMDNTFCTPEEKFPSPEVAYEKLRSHIEETREEDKTLKFYIYCYTLGKEEVFVNLAKDFNTKVQVLKERWTRLETLGISEGFIVHREQQRRIRELK